MSSVIDMKRAARVLATASEGKPVPERFPKPKYEPRVLTLHEVMQTTARHAIDASGPTGYSTGNGRLDSATGRLQPGDVWLLGADTNVGKSTLLTAILDVNLLSGKRCLLVTSEDDEKKYGARLICRRADVSAYALRDGVLDDHEKKLVQDVADRSLPQPFYFDARGVDVEDVAAGISWLIGEHHFDIVACDYLTAFVTKRRFQSPRERVEHISRTLVTAIKRGGAAGILCTQLTVESRYIKPTVHNVRDSRDLGQWCDVAVFLYEQDDGKHGKGSAFIRPGSKMAHVDKVKCGERGTVIELEWSAHRAAFLDSTWTPPPRRKNDREDLEGGFDDM